VLAEPYESSAPEVESLLRLREAGMRVSQVPVHMRERAAGESRILGRPAAELVLTVAGDAGALRRLAAGRSGRGHDDSETLAEPLAFRGP
jgi:hypothetical protein